MKPALVLLLFSFLESGAQSVQQVKSFITADSIIVSIDQPAQIKKNKATIICFYALPNGNTTAQTMGKRVKPDDDWHYDIQHIRAQTAFIRSKLNRQNFVVVYLENNRRSWPAWKQSHPAFRQRIPQLVDSILSVVPGRKKEIYLNGHSGGGSFIFGYLASFDRLPAALKRISFLDSDYGYDSSYYPKIKAWLINTKGAMLNVFAYNDSVALLNGKPFVSATGGTWYRSKLFLQHLRKDFSFENTRNDSLVVYVSRKRRIQFYFKTNPERKIFHTTQVELNGFIHSILCGTKYESDGYDYYGVRGYEGLIMNSEL